MTSISLTRSDRNESRNFMARLAKALCAGAAVAALGACVQVSAPDRPIVIDLNINIRQEVVVRLRDDARELIESERGVF